MTKNKNLKGYICGNDDTELSLGATDVVVYPTIASLKRNRKCWKERGIIELEVKCKIVVKGTLKW